ncbi:unnamed protein product [Rangifer tarandus platyrhynchus]|uniref:Uncharacterized protein n=2 Tax=Rangifer tarandus platyrhynchus TaxID=3082113 RepID=A0AC59ZJY2_RANTA|nr:unnamed protein product [Rangifer tarandus platyrhynchus]
MEKMDGVKRAQEGQVVMRHQKGVRWSEDEIWELPGSTVVKIPCFHCRGAQVRSLVRELRYCPCKQCPHPTPQKSSLSGASVITQAWGTYLRTRICVPVPLGGHSPAMLF